MSSPTSPTAALAEQVATMTIASQAASNEDNRILALEGYHADRVEYINAWKTELRHAKVRFNKGKTTEEDNTTLVPRFDKFADFLRNAVRMTPKLAAETTMAAILGRLLINTEQGAFPESMRIKAQELHAKWVEENWGINDGEVSDDGENSETPASPVSSPSSSPTRVTKRQNNKAKGKGKGISLGLPAENHRIFGKHGIMHGFVMKRFPISYSRDHRYPERNWRRHGHNGLSVGAWYPRQHSAVFHGAHGHKQAGISGTEKDLGAFSIVMSGRELYQGLDTDMGDTVYYSGSGSHENTDSDYPGDSTVGTRALKENIRTRKPVRLFRSAGEKGGSRYHPTVGMRYDGLYRVVGQEDAWNKLGGKYERFVLRRLPGQTPLEELQRISPTGQQVADFDRITDGY